MNSKEMASFSLATMLTHAFNAAHLPLTVCAASHP
jgi:hypothetical protein